MPMPGTPPPDAPVESTPSSADSGQPSLWRRILAGGLLGTAAGMAQKNPYAAPLAAVQAVQQSQQQQFENKRQSDADQRAQTEVQQKQEQIDLEKQNAATQKTLSDANAALALTHKMLIEKQMQQLPDEQRTKISEAWSHITAAYKNSGLSMSTEIDDSNDARAAYLDSIKQSGGKLTDYIFSPDPTNGKIAVFQRDDSKLLDKDNAATISKATGVTIPAGTPVVTADVILSHKMQQDTELQVAEIHKQATLGAAKIGADSRADVADTKAAAAEKKSEGFAQLSSLQGRLLTANKQRDEAEKKRTAGKGLFTSKEREGELDKGVNDAQGSVDQIQKEINELTEKMKNNPAATSPTASLSGAAKKVLGKYQRQ